MRRLISLLALVCLAVSGLFAAQTTVSDNVNTAIGALYGGTVSYVTISWPAFTGADSTAVAAGSTTLTISGGVLSVALTPNYGTGTSYAVWYQAPGGITYRDNWAVPVSGGSVALSACRPTGTLLIGSNATSYVLPGVAPSGGSSSLPSGSGLVKVTSGIGSLASAGADYDPGGAAAAITLSGLSPAMTVGAGGVTANHVIQLSAGQAIAGNGGYGGIAQSTAAAAGSVPVSVSAGITQSCVFETAAVVDDVAIPGTTDKTTCRDSGVTATSAVPNSTTIIGKITSAASIGGTATVRLHGMGVFGTQVQTTSLGSVQGNGAKVQLSTGTTTINDCVKYDANGNTIDAGAACGSGGGGGITALTGDLTASGTGSVAGTLATVNSNVGTFSGLTVNGKGLVTAAANPTTGALVGTSDAQTLTNKTISGASNTITSVPTGALATVQGNGTKVQLSTGTTTSGHCVQYDASGNVIDAGAACGTGGGSGITALTGDLTASGTGSVAGTLATVNSNVGTFNSVTVNGKGLVTAATNGLYPSIVAKTSFYTLLTTDVTATCDATGGAFTLTLPAAPASNQIVFLKKIDSSANTCTVSGNSKTIDGATSVVLASQYQGVALHYNGTNWVRFSDALLDSNLKIPHSTLPTLIQADIPSSITTPLATRIGTGWNFCFAGDSRTAGAGTTTPATQAWPAVLGTLSSLNTRGTVINTSVSGSTISTAQTSPPSLITVYSTVAVPQGTTYGGCQQYSPRVASGHGMLFIMGGVNDFRLLSHTGAQAITDLTTLVTSAQSDSWDRIFVLTNYQHSGGITNAGYETAMEQFNAFIRNNSLNVTTIDIAALLPNPYDQNLFNSDALHANILGNSVIAQKVNSQVWTDGETTVNPIREVNAVSSITGASNQSFYPGCFSALTTGFGDTCAGKLKTGTALTTAQKTTLYGAGLAPVATTGNFATLFGYGSGNLLTTGSSLVFMGVQGFNGVTTASDNIGMGVITCQSQTGGTLVCIGDNTGGGGALTNSVLVGHNTAGNITGSANIMIGNSVANVTASISNSVLIGTSAGVGATGGAGLTFVGHSTGGAGLGGPTIAGGFGYQANASANGAYEIGQGLNSTANSLAFVGNVFVDSNGSLHDKGFIANINPQTASYTLLNTDSVVTFDTTSGAMTATLPVSPAYIGQRVTIMNIGSNTLSISPSPHFLNGATSSITIPTQYGSQVVTYTATNNWVTPMNSTQGNGAKVQLSTGTTTTNDCVKFDANGNTIDAGAACGSGGSGITAITGDLAASGTGSVAGTLATVNSNVGTFTSVTVNGKGLVTAASNSTTGAVVGTTDTQTLTGKSMSGASNTFTNIPTGALATIQGNGTKVQLSTGTTTTNDCVKFDANGNTIDAGATCGSGSATFASLGAGTSAAALVVGTGGSLAVTGSGTIAATTTAALATTPTLCSTGQSPTGILASGNATGCAAIGGAGVITYTVSSSSENLGTDITTNCSSKCKIVIPSTIVMTPSATISVSSSDVEIECIKGGGIQLPAFATYSMFSVNGQNFQIHGCLLDSSLAYKPNAVDFFTNNADVTGGRIYENVIKGSSVFSDSSSTIGIVGGGYDGIIRTVLSVNPGDGYTSAPAVTISGPGGSGASITAVLSSTIHIMTAVTISAAGSGQTQGSYALTATTANCSGIVGTAQVGAGGTTTGVFVNNQGTCTGSSNQTLTYASAGGTAATLTVPIGSPIASYTITSGGTGWLPTPQSPVSAVIAAPPTGGILATATLWTGYWARDMDIRNNKMTNGNIYAQQQTYNVRITGNDASQRPVLTPNSVIAIHSNGANIYPSMFIITHNMIHNAGQFCSEMQGHWSNNGTSGTNDGYITDMTFDNNVCENLMNGAGAGYSFDDVDGAAISNNWWDSNGYTIANYTNCIELVRGLHNTAIGNHCFGGTISVNKEHDDLIQGNYIGMNLGYQGIYAGGSNDTTMSGSAGITSNDNNRFINNTIYCIPGATCTGVGLWLQCNGTLTSIQHNLIQGNIFNLQSGQQAIKFGQTGTVDDNVIRDNEFQNMNYAIDLNGGNNLGTLIVENNGFINIGTNNLSATGGTGTLLTYKARNNLVTASVASTSLTLDATTAETFKYTLTANSAITTLSNAVAGKWYDFTVCPSTFTWTWTSGLFSGFTAPTASVCNVQKAFYNGTKMQAYGTPVTY